MRSGTSQQTDGLLIDAIQRVFVGEEVQLPDVVAALAIENHCSPRGGPAASIIITQ